MANKVTIEVEAVYFDRVSAGMNSAAKSTDRFNKSAKQANTELDKLSKKNVKPKLGADDNAFTKKIREAQSKAEKLGKTKVAATLGAIDKASAKIGDVTGRARAFAGKTFRGALAMADKASAIIGDVTGAARSFAGKTFSAAVKIVDYATTPLRKIKESLFSIKTLIGTIVMGAAAKKTILDPINLADSYSGAKIGFSTLLGETEGQNMMDKIDQFAKETPFKTSGVISNVQKMMAYGWDSSRVISDMETIGDAAAATGKGDEGLASIVYALSEIRSKGKLSTQELNQLASAGIKAKQYLAQGLGYGTDDAGMAKLMADLEDGAVGANQAIELILKGMEEFDGMMDKTANETVEGLWSQIEDAFEINVFRRWGQGLQDGAKKGFGSIVDLLDSSEGALKDFGDLCYDIGKELSNWTADKLENVIEDIKAITQTDAFKKAGLGGKIKLLFEGTVLDPLKKWWNSDEVQAWIDEKKEWFSTKAGEWGKGLGEGLSTGLMALLGVDVGGMVEGGASVGASFAKGFAEGFDGSAVTDAIVDAIGNVWSKLPTWAKWLIGTYGAGKAVSGIGSVVGGAMNIFGAGKGLVSGVGSLIGSTGNSMVHGTGLLNILAGTGYKLTGGAAGSALSGGMAAGAGAGAIAAGVSTVHGVSDLYRSYKSYKAGDETNTKAYAASGGTTLGGVGAGAGVGAAIGSIIPGLGTAVGALIGAGIGGIAGWIGGDKWADNIRKNAAEIEAAKYASKDMQEAIKNTELSAEELEKVFSEACWEDMKKRFGDIELSMAEIETLARDTVFSIDEAGMEKFASATEKAQQSLKTFKSAAADIERLNFDLGEHLWKFNMGIDEKLSDEEIADVKARVQNYISSAEEMLSDSHYQFNAAVEVILQPKSGGDNSTYESIIKGGNSLYAKLQKQLDENTAELEAKYNLYLKDGVITADEQKVLSDLQAKIAEIVNKVSHAETEASFEVSKLKFTTGDLSAESFEQFQGALQSQLDSYVAQQDQALTTSISGLKLQLDEGAINQEQYDEQLQALVDGYNSNIETMTARVNEVQLSGISEAFDGVATAEQLQAAINGVLADGENPVDVTFSDINAHLNLGDDVLKEEEKANFTAVMKAAIEGAATGENALTTVAEVNPDVQISEENRAAVKTELENLIIEDGPISTTAEFHTATEILAANGGPIANEAANGRSVVQGAVDTAFANSFNTTAKINANAVWSLSNNTATVSLNGNSTTLTASINADNNANGGFINGRILSWLGEEGPEAVIPLVPGRRARGLKLWEEAGKRLGVQYHAEGGIVGSDSSPIKAFEGDIEAGGEKKIEINMGGVTIEIKADGNKPIADEIEEQEQAIAEKVAEIFKNVFSAQFANMPVKSTS